MSLLKRTIETTINKYLESDDTKILFVWGPRGSGKTTLIDKLVSKLSIRKYNLDLVSDREKFAPPFQKLEPIV